MRVRQHNCVNFIGLAQQNRVQKLHCRIRAAYAAAAMQQPFGDTELQYELMVELRV